MTPAARYAAWRITHPENHLAEPLFPGVNGKFSELDLQARWFAGHFPKQLKTTTGEAVEIIHLGVWNREPGPDFSDAVVKFGPAAPIRGSIEIDTRARDWETHGHALNPAFNDVLLHLFIEPGRSEFFTRSQENRWIPQVQLALSDRTDISPYPPLASPGRCSSPLATLDPARRESLLEAAAHFRLERKSQAFARLQQSYGWDEALFQSLAIALGYKENKLPFQILAQRIGWKTLRESALDAESILFGCAGFLDATSLRNFAPDTQAYLRSLWDRWWAVREKWQRLILPRTAWVLSGGRPANHPQRRLAALALLVRNWPALSRVFREASSPAEVAGILTKLTHPYWSEHYTLASRKSARPIALLGQTRIAEIVTNVAIPAALSTHPDHWQILRNLRQPLENRKLKTGIIRLFGTDPSLTKNSILQQQGILQIYEDFCLRDLSDCARCPFPEKVRHWAPAYGFGI